MYNIKIKMGENGSMTEIKTDPISLKTAVVFTDEHTVADIVRYAMQQGGYDTFAGLASEFEIAENVMEEEK